MRIYQRERCVAAAAAAAAVVCVSIFFSERRKNVNNLIGINSSSHIAAIFVFVSVSVCLPAPCSVTTRLWMKKIISRFHFFYCIRDGTQVYPPGVHKNAFTFFRRQMLNHLLAQKFKTVLLFSIFFFLRSARINLYARGKRKRLATWCVVCAPVSHSLSFAPVRVCKYCNYNSTATAPATIRMMVGWFGWKHVPSIIFNKKISFQSSVINVIIMQRGKKAHPHIRSRAHTAPHIFSTSSAITWLKKRSMFITPHSLKVKIYLAESKKNRNISHSPCKSVASIFFYCLPFYDRLQIKNRPTKTVIWLEDIMLHMTWTRGSVGPLMPNFQMRSIAPTQMLGSARQLCEKMAQIFTERPMITIAIIIINWYLFFVTIYWTPSCMLFTLINNHQSNISERT